MRDARERLVALARHLDDHLADEHRAGDVAPPDILEWFTAAIRRYLDGEATTLDEALGLKSDQRSKDKLDRDRFDLLCDAHELRYRTPGVNLTWSDISFELNSEKLGIKWRRLCTMVESEHKERLEAYFAELEPRRAAVDIVRFLEKDAIARDRDRKATKKAHYEKFKAAQAAAASVRGSKK